MATAPAWHLFTVAEYHRMGKAGLFSGQRVELLDGEIIDMSPIGRRHNACVDHLNFLFYEGLGRRVVLRVQGSVRLNNRSEPQPDVAVLRGPIESYVRRHAGPDDILLFIEVSDTTLDYDLGRKASHYARNRVPELWVVDLNRERGIVHRDPGSDGYLQVSEARGSAPLNPLALPDFVLTAHEIAGGLG